MGALRQSTEGTLSVVDEVLRAQARRRRLRRAGATVVMLALAALAGLWLSPSPAPAIGPAVVAMPWVAPTGTVTGYIKPCSGVGVLMDTSTGVPLFSAAATVEARPGQERMKPSGDGDYQVVYPTAVAARERVSQNQAFRLDHLAPGRYVILARYAGSNATTSLDVSVAPGQVAGVVLPDPCK